MLPYSQCSQRRVGAVAARDHPVGAALEDGQPLRRRRDLRDELDGAGGVADDADALAGEIVRRGSSAPSGTARRGTSRGRGCAGRAAVQLADAADQHVGGRAPRRRRYAPSRCRSLRRSARRSPRTPKRMCGRMALRRAQSSMYCADLGLRRPLARPVGLLLEREAVEHRRHVAGGARDSCCRARCRRGSPTCSRIVNVSMPARFRRMAEPEPAEAAADDHDAPRCCARHTEPSSGAARPPYGTAARVRRAGRALTRRAGPPRMNHSRAGETPAPQSVPAESWGQAVPAAGCEVDGRRPLFVPGWMRPCVWRTPDGRSRGAARPGRKIRCLWPLFGPRCTIPTFSPGIRFRPIGGCVPRRRCTGTTRPASGRCRGTRTSSPSRAIRRRSVRVRAPCSPT